MAPPPGTHKAGKLCALLLRSPPSPLRTSGASGPSSILEPPPLDHSRTGSNPPRTTTSLLALVSSRHQLGKIKPSGKKQPALSDRLGSGMSQSWIRLWEKKNNFWMAASARLSFSCYPGQPVTALRPSLNTLRHSGILWDVRTSRGGSALPLAGPGRFPIGPAPADGSSVSGQTLHPVKDPDGRFLSSA